MALGLAVAFSPVHLGLLFWLMLGPHGLLPASLLVGSWQATSALTIGLLPTASTEVIAPHGDGLAAVALVTVAGLGFGA